MNLFNQIFKFINQLNISTHIMPILFVSDIPNIYLNSTEYNIFCIRLFNNTYNNTIILLKNKYNLSNKILTNLVIKYTDLINIYILDKEIITYILKRNKKIINQIYQHIDNTYVINNLDNEILNSDSKFQEKIFFSKFLYIKDKYSILSSIAHKNDANKIDIINSFIIKTPITIATPQISYEDRHELFRLIKHFSFKCKQDNIQNFIINKSSIIKTSNEELLIFLIINIHLDIYISKNQMIICSKKIKELISKNFQYSEFHTGFKRIMFIEINHYPSVYKVIEFINYSKSKFIHIVLDDIYNLEFVKNILKILNFINMEFVLYNLLDININIQ